MALITGILIASSLGMSLSVEWTFQKWNEFSTSSNNSSPLCVNTRKEILKCCGVCGGIPECTSIVLNNDHCICSSEPIPQLSQVDNNTSVYVKRPKSCSAPGYIFINNMCIKVSTDKNTWHEAKLDCENTGGNLIILDSLEKHQRVFDMLNQYFEKTAAKYFVGAFDIEEEGTWKWIKENSSNYMHDVDFDDNDTDFDGLGADCGALNSRKNLLNDQFCDDPTKYICEVGF